MTRATGLFATLAALALAAPARAQDSQFGLRGLGTPGRWESVRARSTGGALAPFDAVSPLLEGAVGRVRPGSASAAGGEAGRTPRFRRGGAPPAGPRLSP